MNTLGYNISLFKKQFESDSYWSKNLGLRDFNTIKYLFNRIYEEQSLLEKYRIVQEIINYSRSRHQIVPKYNTYVYQELRNQFESFQNELKVADWQIDQKMREQDKYNSKIFND